jgi:hypothetical protein
MFYDPFCGNAHQHELTLEFVFMGLKAETIDYLNFEILFAEGACEMCRNVRHEWYTGVRIEVVCNNVGNDHGGNFTLADGGRVFHCSVT